MSAGRAISDSELYLAKAVESLAGAESELTNRRYNNCANRCYYACFQAAVAALVRAGVRPGDPRGRWGHEFVKDRFADDLIGRRHRYPADLRPTLDRLFTHRQTADYLPKSVTRTDAERAVRRARAFINAVQQESGGSL